MSYRLASDLRIVQPFPHILAFYDGRIAGLRVHSDAPNWLDNGAFGLGTATFAIVDGDEAIVYDSHMSVPHAVAMREALEARGIRAMTLVLSHWHPDHVAGNTVFADCEIIANTHTARLLEENRASLEQGSPPISPLVLPNRTFEETLTLKVGRLEVHLHRFDIHSIDGTVMLVPEHGVLLAGDTLEDTVTYVTEPTRLDDHLKDLARMRTLDFETILPCHGTLEKISGPGYDRDFITATEIYVRKLIALRDNAQWAAQSLTEFAAEALETGAIEYFEPYEAVHRANVEAVLGDKP